MSVNILLSQTLNKYSDLRRSDRACHEITNILSLIDDPEMKLLQTFLSKPTSFSMQNRNMEEKLDHLVQSLEKKMKSSAAVSSLSSVTKLASATANTNEREVKNVRNILKNYRKRQNVTNRLFQLFFEDVKKLSLLMSDLTEKEVETMDIPDVDCNLSELHRDLIDRKPSYEELNLSNCAQWVLQEFKRCLSQLEDGRTVVNARRSQKTRDSIGGVDLENNRRENMEVGSLKQEMEKTDDKPSELLADVGVLREERDHLAALLEVEIRGREQCMVEKQELVERLEEVSNMLNTAVKSKDLAVEEIRTHIERRDKLRQELATTKQEKDSLESELFSVKQQLESFTGNVVTEVLTSSGEKLDSEEREMEKKNEKFGLMKQLEESRVEDVLRVERDKLAAMLEVETKGRQQLMVEVKELMVSNMLNTAEKSRDVAIGCLLKQLAASKESLVTHKKRLEDADSRTALLESRNKELVANNRELKREVEKLEVETKELKARLKSDDVQNVEADAEILNCDIASDPTACSTPKKCKDGSERGNLFSFADIQNMEGAQVYREEEINHKADTLAPNCDPGLLLRKFESGRNRVKFYSIKDIQRVLVEFGLVDGIEDKLMDFFELISEGEESEIVNRKIVDIILEESPLLLKAK